MELREAIGHVLLTGVLAVGVFSLINLNEVVEPIYYVFTFILGGILRTIAIFITNRKFAKSEKKVQGGEEK